MPIHISTEIPSGNACAITVTRDAAMPVVALTADPHGGPEALWFCFRIESEGYAGPLRWELRHMGNLLGGPAPETVRPVMRAGAGAWERLPPGRRRDEPDGQWTGLWTLELAGEPVEIAFCYPYGPEEVAALAREGWRADVIGVSQAGRPLTRLCNAYGAPGDARPGVYTLARQHSGETPGSWVLDGFLRRMAEAGDRAPLVWSVPLANLDGVIQGDYGKDNYPYDLNRAWGAAPMRHEILAIQHDLHRWRERCRPLLCLDFHAPGGDETAGVYAFLPAVSADALLMRRTLEWGQSFSAALTEEYVAEPVSRFATYPSRWDTPTITDFCAHRLGIPALTFETPYAEIRGTVLTPARYRDIGGRLAEGVLRALGDAAASGGG